ncbi:MAG TPA: 2-oxoglutarate dehydrogenase complex dihydrolipoyllysine-residue succinyltransferase [Roseiflexaceae bacterium]|nr:2-oxoglutarate dehydrogenase complex dihydrolipoyllysine-residue succinyltransferase [Roseiflexaceae bacterium]HMP41779.1 2-oxoglutarate dehydrogenase complex dihydrolipoyllysine-residue succinyltransferase [Roseiflexaceae bacterium]
MAREIKVPTLGESIIEATVGKWLKREGDAIAAGEAVVDLETDKVNIEVMAEEAGVLEQIVKAEGANVTIGEVLGMIAAGTGISANTPPPVNAAKVEPPPADRLPPVTPVARRMAAEQGVDPANLPGSGPGGRVTRNDVLAQAAAPPPAATPPAATLADDRREERIRMTRRRQTIAQRLVQAQQTAAMLTTFNEIDMAAVIDLRKRRRDAFKERHGVGLGFMSFFTRAVIGALKAQPLLNAEIQGDEIVVKHYYDIGIAVSTAEGLVVPVVRDADRLTFAGIEKGIEDLARRARDGKLSLAELQGGSFTITNGGIFGSLMSTPILNTPQVGILGMHKIQERPMAIGGQVVIRPMMYVALSYDHRIVDGAEAVRFLVRVKELVEDPEALLLEG